MYCNLETWWGLRRGWKEFKNLNDKKINDSQNDVEIDAQDKGNSRALDDQQEKAKWEAEWAQVALVLDRLFFWLYLLVLIVGTVGFFLAPLEQFGTDISRKLMEYNRGFQYYNYSASFGLPDWLNDTLLGKWHRCRLLQIRTLDSLGIIVSYKLV